MFATKAFNWLLHQNNWENKSNNNNRHKHKHNRNDAGGRSRAGQGWLGRLGWTPERAAGKTRWTRSICESHLTNGCSLLQCRLPTAPCDSVWPQLCLSFSLSPSLSLSLSQCGCLNLWPPFSKLLAMALVLAYASTMPCPHPLLPYPWARVCAPVCVCVCVILRILPKLRARDKINKIN